MKSPNPPFNPEAIFQLLRGRVEEAELFQTLSESRPVVFKGNRLKSSETVLACGAGLRIIAKGRIGFATSNNPDAIASLVDRALRGAVTGEPATFSLPKLQKPNRAEPKVYSEEVAMLSLEAKRSAGQNCIDTLLSRFPKLSIDLETGSSISTTFLHNTNGLALSTDETQYGFGMSALSAGDDGLLWLSKGNSSSKLDIRYLNYIEECTQLLHHAAQIVPTGKPATIIMAPTVIETLSESFLMALNGKTVYKGISPLSRRLGERVTDPRFSITEEPFLDWKGGSLHDSEGVPRSSKALIDKGVPQSFIYDLSTAGLSGNHSTGNGARSYASLPSPGFSNLVIAGGNQPLRKIISETRNGLWIHSVLGAGQSNMLAGDFSLNTHLAFRIENGTILGRVKDTMVSGNIYDIFNRITEISMEQDDSSSFISPSIAFENINVTG